MLTPENVHQLGRIKQIPGSALFSPDLKYRYILSRKWSEGNKICTFVMCNPSTADAYKLDPTVMKCLQWSILWDYDELIVVNIFAYRSTDPKQLYQVEDPIGPENDKYLSEVFKKSQLVIGAWSNHGRLLNRSAQIKGLAKSCGICLNVLRLNKTGEPEHPLYLAKSLAPIPWNYEATINDV